MYIIEENNFQIEQKENLIQAYATTHEFKEES